jgi:hypothetical protein
MLLVYQLSELIHFWLSTFSNGLSAKIFPMNSKKLFGLMPIADEMNFI